MHIDTQLQHLITDIREMLAITLPLLSADLGDEVETTGLQRVQIIRVHYRTVDLGVCPRAIWEPRFVTKPADLELVSARVCNQTVQHLSAIIGQDDFARVRRMNMEAVPYVSATLALLADIHFGFFTPPQPRPPA